MVRPWGRKGLERQRTSRKWQCGWRAVREGQQVGQGAGEHAGAHPTGTWTLFWVGRPKRFGAGERRVFDACGPGFCVDSCLRSSGAYPQERNCCHLVTLFNSPWTR